MARGPTGTKRWHPVCGELSADQRMPRLCSRWTRHLHLEFRCPRKIPWHVVPRHDSRTTVGTKRPAPFRLRTAIWKPLCQVITNLVILRLSAWVLLVRISSAFVGSHCGCSPFAVLSVCDNVLA